MDQLPGHDKPAGFVANFHDHAAVSGAQLPQLVEVVVGEFPDLLLLTQEYFNAFSLRVVHLQLFQTLGEVFDAGFGLAG